MASWEYSWRTAKTVPPGCGNNLSISGDSIETRFPASDFDEWAGSYDADAAAEHGFPFQGYTRVLAEIFAAAGARPGQRVLDAGVGTGNLAALFSAMGCEIWGVDFSPAMLAKAADRLPAAHLFQADLAADWPAGLYGPFERIVSAYTFHHFELEQKVEVVTRLSRLLAPGGRIVIADIAFENQAALEEARFSAADWEEEPFWIADEALRSLAAAGFYARFRPVPPWAGVFQIIPESEPL